MPSPAALTLFPEMEPAALAAQAMVNAAEALERGAAICVHVRGGRRLASHDRSAV